MTTSKEELLSRIISDPKVMVGKPIIRGTRITVELILELLTTGWTKAEILKEYPGITEQDILACLQYQSVKLAI